MKPKKSKSYSDEFIIAALLENGTLTAAAHAIGCSVTTIVQRQKEPAFVEAYEQARRELVRAAVDDLTNKLKEANAALCEIVSDKKINPFARIQAAQAIYSCLDKLKRLDRCEEMQTALFSGEDDPFSKAIDEFCMMN